MSNDNPFDFSQSTGGVTEIHLPVLTETPIVIVTPWSKPRQPLPDDHPFAAVSNKPTPERFPGFANHTESNA